MYQWTVPAGVSWARLHVWGAGGAGGTPSGDAAGSGGAGAYVSGWLRLSPGQVVTASVGLGGSLNGSVAVYASNNSVTAAWAAGGASSWDALSGTAGGSGGWASFVAVVDAPSSSASASPASSAAQQSQVQLNGRLVAIAGGGGGGVGGHADTYCDGGPGGGFVDGVPPGALRIKVAPGYPGGFYDVMGGLPGGTAVLRSAADPARGFHGSGGGLASGEPQQVFVPGTATFSNATADGAANGLSGGSAPSLAGTSAGGGGGGGWVGGSAGWRGCGGGGSSWWSGLCAASAWTADGYGFSASVPADAGAAANIAYDAGLSPGQGGYLAGSGQPGFIAIDWGVGRDSSLVPPECIASASVAPTPSASASASPTMSGSPSASRSPAPPACSVANSASCSAVSVAIAPPPSALADSRYAQLQAPWMLNTSMLATATLATTATARALVVSDALPAASMIITLPNAPADGETVVINCNASSELADLVLVQPSSLVVTSSSFSSLPDSILTVRVQVSVPYIRKPPGSAQPPIRSFDSGVLCRLASTMQAGGEQAPRYAGSLPVAVPVVLLSSSWPFFGDAVREDNVTAALRSSWGSSSIPLGPSAQRFFAPVTQPVAHVRLLAQAGRMDDYATVIKRHALPAPWAQPFTLTVSGSSVLAIVADTWQWTNGSDAWPSFGDSQLTAAAELVAFAGLNASLFNSNASSPSSSAGRTAGTPQVGFFPGTRVFLGAIECAVLGMSSDGSVMRVRTPSYREICGQDPSDEAVQSCGSRPLIIANPGLLGPLHLHALARGGADAAAVQAAVDAATAGSAVSLSLSGPQLAAIGGMAGCPRFCPGSEGGVPPLVSFTQAASDSSSAGSGSSSTAVVAIAPDRSGASGDHGSAGSFGAFGGVTYTVACTGALYENVPSIDVCLNSSDPLSRRCPFGGAEQCSDCPPCALCPGGFRALPLSGCWSASERSAAVVSCAYPSSRCLGFNATTGSVQCGQGYAQGSSLCGTCADGYFENDRTGACDACPPRIDAWTALRPLVLFIGVLAAIGFTMGIVIVAMTLRHGGTVKGGLRRTMAFTIACIGVLQLVIQVGQAAQPGLPLLLFRLYELLALLQLKGITLPPACLSTPPFLQEIIEMGVAMGLIIALSALFINYRRICGCSACGSGREGRAKAVTVTVAGKTPAKSAKADAGAVQLSCCLRSGALCDRLKPTLRRIVFMGMVVLYATVSNAVFNTLSCTSVHVTVSAYLSALDGDGSTLVKQLGKDESSLGPLCLDPDCLVQNPLYSRVVQVSVVQSSPGFVCYEGPHRPAALLAWITLAVFVVGLPLSTLLLVRRRIAQIMQRGPLRPYLEVAAAKDHLRRRAWIAAADMAHVRWWRSCCAQACGLGSRFSADAAADSSVKRRYCCSCSAVPITPTASATGELLLPPAAFSSTSSSSSAAAVSPGPQSRPRGARPSVLAARGAAKPAIASAAGAAAGASQSGGGQGQGVTIVTANGLIDGNGMVTGNSSLAVFTGSDFRASRFWLRNEDMALVLYLGLLAAFYPTSPDVGPNLLLLALILASAAVDAGLYLSLKPLRPDTHWLLFVRMSALLLTSASAALNCMNAIFKLDADDGNSSSDEDTPRPVPVVVLSYLTFVFAVLLAVVLVVAFLVSSRSGARKEQARVDAAAVAVATTRQLRRPSAMAARAAGKTRDAQEHADKDHDHDAKSREQAKAHGQGLGKSIRALDTAIADDADGSGAGSVLRSDSFVQRRRRQSHTTDGINRTSFVVAVSLRTRSKGDVGRGSLATITSYAPAPLASLPPSTHTSALARRVPGDHDGTGLYLGSDLAASHSSDSSRSAPGRRSMARPSRASRSEPEAHGLAAFAPVLASNGSQADFASENPLLASPSSASALSEKAVAATAATNALAFASSNAVRLAAAAARGRHRSAVTPGAFDDDADSE